MQNLPFFWPTKTLILDDSKVFLEEIKEMLDHNENYIFFTDPEEALDYIDSQIIKLDGYINSPISTEESLSQYNLNYNLIQSITANDKRFNLVSNVIVDYHMPQMSGVDFCKLAANDKFLRKTLLTSSMDYSKVIENLNDQIIDSFIDKKNISQNGLLKKHIDKEQRNYFLKSGNFIIEALDFDNSKSAVLSKEYNRIIKKIIFDLNINEYYLLNKSGLYFMISKNLIKYYIFLFSQDEIEEMALEAQDQELNENVCLALQNREKAVCYYSKNNSSSWPDYKDWEKYLYSLEEFSIANKNYYYAIVDKSF